MNLVVHRLRPFVPPQFILDPINGHNSIGLNHQDGQQCPRFGRSYLPPLMTIEELHRTESPKPHPTPNAPHASWSPAITTLRHRPVRRFSRHLTDLASGVADLAAERPSRIGVPREQPFSAE